MNVKTQDMFLPQVDNTRYWIMWQPCRCVKSNKLHKFMFIQILLITHIMTRMSYAFLWYAAFKRHYGISLWNMSRYVFFNMFQISKINGITRQTTLNILLKENMNKICWTINLTFLCISYRYHWVIWIVLAKT